MRRPSSRPRRAFTLVEVLVSITVLALLVALIGQLLINTTAASSISSNHMESDARVRLLFERMAADFSHILKRSDIDYSLKSPSYTAWPYGTQVVTAANTQDGPANDQMAFFSEVAGYSDVSGVQQNSPALVAYRVNTTGTAPCIERLGKALAWSGGTAGIFPIAFYPATIAVNWPAATTSATDQDYETLVPNAFRFEYYYQLHSGALSATPWDTAAGHTALNGLADVAGIGVVVAVTDRKSTPLIAPTALTTLAGQLPDFPKTFPSGMTVGGLQASWQTKIAAYTTLNTNVRSGIRVYEQLFSIDTPSQ